MINKATWIHYTQKNRLLTHTLWIRSMISLQWRSISGNICLSSILYVQRHIDSLLSCPTITLKRFHSIGLDGWPVWTLRPTWVLWIRRKNSSRSLNQGKSAFCTNRFLMKHIHKFLNMKGNVCPGLLLQKQFRISTAIKICRVLVKINLQKS